MWLKLAQLRVPLKVTAAQLHPWVARRLGLEPGALLEVRIGRKSLDARHKNPVFIYTLYLRVDLAPQKLDDFLKHHAEFDLTLSQLPAVVPLRVGKAKPPISFRPVIVGAGPAGLFAGLKLAAAGFKPLIIERGDGLAGRIARVDRFWRTGELDPESNIHYGCGGAGTFSDGKLTTRIKDPRVAEILQILVELGAPEEIRYLQLPHIGTDLLREVVTRLERLIVDYGGEIRFRKRLTDLRLEQGRIRGVTINAGAENLETELLLLAVGNSARDLYPLLLEKGLKIEAKPIAVGLRIEHPQDLIDRAQYGGWAGNPQLGPGEYRLTYQDRESRRGVYTFCMCPGGQVVGAASEACGVVTNGMSYHARNSGVANAAIVVTIPTSDYGDTGPLGGIAFQRRLEQKAYEAGGGGFFAPAQRVADFLRREPSWGFTALKPSYLPGTRPANLWEVLPPHLCLAIASAIRRFGRELKGFDWPDAVLTGVETRTSAPVRIVRNEEREAQGFAGIYPVGEGAGYAGGIISSALDGWKTAEAICKRYGV